MDPLTTAILGSLASVALATPIVALARKLVSAFSRRRRMPVKIEVRRKDGTVISLETTNLEGVSDFIDLYLTNWEDKVISPYPEGNNAADEQDRRKGDA
ncbi:MAG: hypothetical protein GY854_16030 [Deltaproteobacteria bacterium]|nr:hypothetical protein [Deltaproteobacteria bacterium]